MPVLRIVEPVIVRLGTAPGTVTLSGTTKKSGVPVRRTINIYADRGLTMFLATVYSNAAGEWSATVPGGGASRFTVVAIGEAGENNQIFAAV